MAISKKLAAGLVAVAAVAAGSVAFAAIPGANGVISGCYNKTSGALRVADTQTNTPRGCTDKEAALAWSQQGPPGPKGDPGITLFANIAADGKVISGPVWTSTRIGTGKYILRFTGSPDVGNCAATAVPGLSAGAVGSVDAQMARVDVGNNGYYGNDIVRVYTFNSVYNDLIDSPFHLIVAC